MHLVTKLLGRVQARYTSKFNSAYESKLSTHNKLACALYLENRILNKNLKYQKFVKLRYNKTSEEKLTKVSWRKVLLVL